jgi:hypothetical protein
MIYTLQHHTSKIFAIIPIVFVAATVSSCGHTQAAPAPVPIETVMNTVRDYGPRSSVRDFSYPRVRAGRKGWRGLCVR